MTMLIHTAARRLIAAAATSPGELRAQPTAARWICLYRREPYPRMEPIGLLEDDGGHGAFGRCAPGRGRMYFVRRVSWDRPARDNGRRRGGARCAGCA